MKAMPLTLDVPRARQALPKLLTAYEQTGIFGKKEMPEDMLPPRVEAGSEEHLRFITLTVAIDYQRDADQLWEAARRTYGHLETRYLFDPTAVARTGMLQIVADMQRFHLTKKPEKDAQIWQTISCTLTSHFEGRVGNLIGAAKTDAGALLKLISTRPHASGFPFLKGPKIGPLWVRMLHDNCGVQLTGLADIPIPVDVHTAQATLQIGAVRAEGWKGTMLDLRKAVQAVWREAVTGTETYPLRLDEPLWHLSRIGCRKLSGARQACRGRCPVGAECLPKLQWLSIAGEMITDGSECTVRGRDHDSF